MTFELHILSDKIFISFLHPRLGCTIHCNRLIIRIFGLNLPRNRHFVWRSGLKLWGCQSYWCLILSSSSCWIWRRIWGKSWGHRGKHGGSIWFVAFDEANFWVKCARSWFDKLQECFYQCSYNRYFLCGRGNWIYQRFFLLLNIFVSFLFLLAQRLYCLPLRSAFRRLFAARK